MAKAGSELAPRVTDPGAEPTVLVVQRLHRDVRAAVVRHGQLDGLAVLGAGAVRHPRDVNRASELQREHDERTRDTTHDDAE